MSKDLRKAKEAIDVDLFKPLNLDNFEIKDSDCFGRQWNPQHKECAACSRVEICGTVFNNVYLKKREKEVKKKIGKGFLDEVNFERIPKDKLLKEIKQKSGEITVTQLLKFIKHYSKCEDDKTVVTWLKNFKNENSLTIKKGIVYVK